MLIKLLKYEIKATGRIFLPLFLALLVFAGITKLISTLGPEKWHTPAMISMAIYVVIMVGMFVMTFVMMIQRFYKNLLSDEGYLMFTLPVKSWKHILCKLLVSMLWMVASGTVALISILIIAGNITKIIGEFPTFYHQVFERFGPSAYLWSFELIIGLLVSLASAILIIYASIAIGHLFSQHKILASFGAFIVLNTFSQILFMLFSLIPGNVFFSNIHVTFNNIISVKPVIELGIAYGIVISGLICATYFAATNFILSKRLNLE